MRDFFPRHTVKKIPDLLLQFRDCVLRLVEGNQRKEKTKNDVNVSVSIVIRRTLQNNSECGEKECLCKRKGPFGLGIFLEGTSLSSKLRRIFRDVKLRF